MAFSVTDFNDLKQLLAEHPEWRVELRRLLLGDDFETLPDSVRELREAQKLTEQRVAELVAAVRELAEAQRRTELRLAAFEEHADRRFAALEEAQRQTELRLAAFEEHADRRFAALEEAQRQTDLRLAELAEAQRRTEQAVRALAEYQREMDQRLTEADQRLDERLARVEYRLNKIDAKLARVDGRTLELIYERKTPAYFGRWLRRAEVVNPNDIREQLEEKLSAEQLDDVLLTDLVVRGRVAARPDRPEVLLAVEISSVVDREDVERAVRRAEWMRAGGLAAIPVVAGEGVTQGGEQDAKTRGVALLTDGSTRFWSEALAAWPV